MSRMIQDTSFDIVPGVRETNLYYLNTNSKPEAVCILKIKLKNGEIIPQSDNSFSLTRHPRTAAGIINKRTVLFVVIDGKQPEYSNGMPLNELARMMKTLGAGTAINSDGDGSSTFVSLDEKTGKWIVRNKPSGKEERAVADARIVVKY